MEYALLTVVLFLVKTIIQIAWHYRSASGTLRIDHSNPLKDIYRIEIDDLDKLSRKRRVVLKVDHNADLSQQ